MWMKIDGLTGEIIERGLADASDLVDGEEAVRETTSPIAVWTPSLKAWRFDAWLAAIQHVEDDLEAMRQIRWELVKEARQRAEAAGCVTALGRVDTDPDSQRKVSGAVQLAMISQAAGQPFEIDWTMQDNTSETHDAAAMIGLGVAVGQHVAGCHSIALMKRSAIMAATTIQELEAIGIEDFWPVG